MNKPVLMLMAIVVLFAQSGAAQDGAKSKANVLTRDEFDALIAIPRKSW